MTRSVGLTGGIGSGKSTVAKKFAERGIPIIDTDAIAHALTQPGGLAIPEIVATWGVAMLDAQGALDRRQMRELVFSDAHALEQLEAILHPLILQESRRQAETASSPYALVVVPLLVEQGQHYRPWLEKIIVVDVPDTFQIARTMQRSGLDEDTVRRIMAAQASRDERLAIADWVINNAGTLDLLEPQVDAIHQALLQTAG